MQLIYDEKYRNEGEKLSVLKPFSPSLSLGWRSPSNIALVKYWGKTGNQIPLNPSLSITLQNSFSETTVEFCYTGKGRMDAEFYFEGKPMPDFSSRIFSYLGSLIPFFPFLQNLSLKIDSLNSFPHSSGIASSASAMSSLALCLVSVEREFYDTPVSESDFFAKASFLARLGSGSAARSVFPGFALWGKHQTFPYSNDEKGIPAGMDYHEIFKGMYDSVLVVDPGKKKVSSSAGHRMMQNHPYKDARISQANNHIEILQQALLKGDIAEFVRITELEALSLHALMMSSDPGYILINNKTMAIIEEIRSFRQSTGIPACFTLDAGPNVHLLYPAGNRQAVERFIREKLAAYCHEGNWIDDRMGTGPVRIL